MKSRMTSEERRASIVASAIHLFAEKGFRGATTRELAAALGVTEPVLYQHFATKSELYCAIIEAKAAEGEARAGDFLKHLEGNDDRAFFSEVAELILYPYDEDHDFIRLLLFSALEGHELARHFYASHMARFQEMVAGYLRRRTKEGALRAVHPLIAARSFIGMVAHHGNNHVLFERHTGKIGRKKLIDEIVSMFLEGISCKPNGGSK